MERVIHENEIIETVTWMRAKQWNFPKQKYRQFCLFSTASSRKSMAYQIMNAYLLCAFLEQKYILKESLFGCWLQVLYVHSTNLWN
jgi:hypothetical protein